MKRSGIRRSAPIKATQWRSRSSLRSGGRASVSNPDRLRIVAALSRCAIEGLGREGCFGSVVGHEMRKRSQGGPIDQEWNVVGLCAQHNGWVEDHPMVAELVGLVAPTCAMVWGGEDGLVVRAEADRVRVANTVHPKWPVWPAWRLGPEWQEWRHRSAESWRSSW